MVKFTRNNWIPPFDSMKITTRFLWLPKTIQSETRWLERATWIGRVVTWEDKRTHESIDWQWEDERWLDSDEEVEQARVEHVDALTKWSMWKRDRR
jgi:hypothetical protein